jgi:hypothetical protein
LASSGLRGFAFAEVWKKRIVKLDWRSCDLDTPDPARYPAGGEPENYVLGQKHNPDVADQPGTMWEVVIERTLDNPGDADIVRRWLPGGSLLVSDSARDWLLRHGDGWLTFEPHP